MNYYERHIGDYIKDTVSLSMLEDGAYNRLIDQYYQSETPLPLERKEIYKLARATKAAEKKAVDYVLEKYFEKTEHGFVQKRVQEEIEKFWEKDAESAVEKDNAKVRQQRARERRKALFDALRSHGEVPKYNTPTRELQDLLSRVTQRNNHKPVTPNVTRDDTAIQSPVTNPQTPVNTEQSSSRTSNGVGTEETRDGERSDPPVATVDPPPPELTDPKRHVDIAILLRQAGVKPFSFAHPLAMEWAQNDAVTDDILRAAVQQARDYKPSGDISPNYLKPIVEQLIHPPDPRPQKSAEDGWWKSKAGIERKGRELGMFARGTEDHDSFKDRIFEELRKRGGKAA